jgi:hypothetical protein
VVYFIVQRLFNNDKEMRMILNGDVGGIEGVSVIYFKLVSDNFLSRVNPRRFSCRMPGSSVEFKPDVS